MLAQVVYRNVVMEEKIRVGLSFFLLRRMMTVRAKRDIAIPTRGMREFI